MSEISGEGSISAQQMVMAPEKIKDLLTEPSSPQSIILMSSYLLGQQLWGLLVNFDGLVH